MAQSEIVSYSNKPTSIQRQRAWRFNGFSKSTASDLIKHTDDIARAVASLNGFARRGILKCKACGDRCTHYHIAECLPLQQIEPVHFGIWTQMNVDSLIRLKDNKIVTESIIVPATIIATAEAVNKIVPHFTILDEFACLSQANTIPPNSQRPVKRRPTQYSPAQSSPRAGRIVNTPKKARR